ncbi:molybdopterin-binding protein [Streptosporangium sp. NPDC000396]|uniref:TOBE domain-containing protein n=1 Tax=Streptosporangium sp. NPDC000396 TaxID=3366185 RepID=UPI0036976CA9
MSPLMAFHQVIYRRKNAPGEPATISAKGSVMRLSARNKIPARVTAITHGEATANVELDASGVRLVASITVEAARELGLSEGSKVVAVVKASDLIVAVED